MDLIVRELKLVKSECEAKGESDGAKLGNIGLEFNITKFEEVEKNIIVADFSFIEKGYEGEKPKEFFLVESHFQATTEIIRSKNSPKKLSHEIFEVNFVGKVYPFMRSLHMQLTQSMGIKADLPWDIPHYKNQKANKEKTKSVKPKKAAKGTKKKTK